MRWALVAVVALALAAGVVVLLRPQPLVAIEAEGLSPNINERVEAALAPFGKDARAEKLPEMQRQAEAAFADALEAHGLGPFGYRLVVHIDQLVGPMCFVTEPGGRSWPLPAFSGEVERAVQKK